MSGSPLLEKSNAISGFCGSGIYPVEPNALSDAEFAISDLALGEQKNEKNHTNLKT